MKIKIGEAVSLSAPSSFEYKLDDRQKIIETDGGNIVQDYGYVPSGDVVSCRATFERNEFLKLWDYFVNRTLVAVYDHAGNKWEGIRVKIISYGYEERFEKYINVEMNLWRI